METIYQWLYHTYACPAMSSTNREQSEILDRFIGILPKEKQLAAYDLVTYIRSQWGRECFTLGVQLGMELQYAPARDESAYKILLDFLTQLDQPVA